MSLPPVAGARLYRFHVAICMVQNQYCCPPSSCRCFSAKRLMHEVLSYCKTKINCCFTNFPDATTIHQATRLSSNHLHIALATLKNRQGTASPHENDKIFWRSSVYLQPQRFLLRYTIENFFSTHETTKRNVERFMIQFRGGMGWGAGAGYPSPHLEPPRETVGRSSAPAHTAPRRWPT